MSERPMRVLTGLTGLLIVAGVNDLAGERGVAAIGAAYAQPLGAQEEEFEGEESAGDGGFFEESGEAQTEDAGAAFAGDESEGSADASAPEAEEEESASADDTAAADGPAEGEAVPAEPAVDQSAQSRAGDQAAPPPTSPPAAHSGTEATVREALYKAIREIVPGLESYTFQDSDTLAGLGANSVDRAEITMMVAESLGLSIPRVEFFGPKNIGELVQLFVSKLHGR